LRDWEYPHTVATKIKLMRLGKMRAPYYRIVVADARTKRDGRSIEMIGKYHPKEDPSFIEVDSERAQYWLGVGAQPTEAVAAIFRVTGDWQKFKGEPAPPPMKVKAPKPDKLAAFQAASRESVGEPADGATTPRKKAAPSKASAAKADSTSEPTAKADSTSEPTAKADSTSEPTAKADSTSEPTAPATPSGETPSAADPPGDAPDGPIATAVIKGAAAVIGAVDAVTSVVQDDEPAPEESADKESADKESATGKSADTPEPADTAQTADKDA